MNSRSRGNTILVFITLLMIIYPEMQADTAMNRFTDRTPNADPAAGSGSIMIGSCPAIFPLVERLAWHFIDEGFDGSLTIDRIAARAGLQRMLVSNEYQLFFSSRKLTPEELGSAGTTGRRIAEFPLPADKFVATVSADNRFVDDVSIDELAFMFSYAASWTEVRPQWPNQPILRFIPESGSGMYERFVEMVFGGKAEPHLLASHLQFTDGADTAVRGIAGNPSAVGYLGYHFYQANREMLRVVPVNGIVPSFDVETSLSLQSDSEGSFSFSWYLYADIGTIQADSAAAVFAAFLYRNYNEAALPLGYPPMTEDIRQQSRELWNQIPVR